MTYNLRERVLRDYAAFHEGRNVDNDHDMTNAISIVFILFRIEETRFFWPHWILEEFSTRTHVIVKETLKKNDLISGKSNVSLLIIQVQAYKFVDFLHADMQTSNEYPDHHLVLPRKRDAFIR